MFYWKTAHRDFKVLPTVIILSKRPPYAYVITYMYVCVLGCVYLCVFGCVCVACQHPQQAREFSLFIARTPRQMWQTCTHKHTYIHTYSNTHTHSFIHSHAHKTREKHWQNVAENTKFVLLCISPCFMYFFCSRPISIKDEPKTGKKSS